MRNYSIFLILASLFCTSCNPDDGFIPKRVTEVNAFDLDNNGNVSDIRVDFIVTDNLNVTEYRIMVIPANSSNSFDQNVAVSISNDSYFEETPIPFTSEYTIPRLPSTLLDVNGALITNGVEYVVVILVVEIVEGTVNYQLSEFSRPYTLLNRGIYSGVYEVVTDVIQQIRVDSAIIVLVNDKYTGSIFGFTLTGSTCNISEFIDMGAISLKISGNTVSEFIWEEKYAQGAGDGCAIRSRTTTGEGVLLEELTIVLDRDIPIGGSTGVDNLVLRRL